MRCIKLVLIFVTFSFGLQLNAQIGYQVSLLNSATGEPRANETVSVDVEISNSEGAVICSETKSATTNEFGVLSLQVGNATTFENVDWSKLPLYVSATVDGIMVGKSQILNVPVAEAAKNLVSVSQDLICRTWSRTDIFQDQGSQTFNLTLNADYTFTFFVNDKTLTTYTLTGKYFIMGNLVLISPGAGDSIMFHYLPSYFVYENNLLYGGGSSSILSSIIFY